MNFQKGNLSQLIPTVAVTHSTSFKFAPLMSSQKSDQPTGGGSLLLAWQLKDKRVVLIGGGDVASGRIDSLLVADALITLISPAEGLHPLTQQHIARSDRITYLDRPYAGPSDLDGAAMLMTAIDDVDLSREIANLCRARNIPVNAADIPPSCDFYFGSQIRDGPLQIMVSTNGRGPKLASIIRKKIAEAIPQGAGLSIERTGALRAKLRERAPGGWWRAWQASYALDDRCV